MKLIAIDLKLQVKLKSFNYDSAHSVALSSLGLSVVDHLALRVWEGLPLGALVNGAQSGAGQGREPSIIETLSFACNFKSIAMSFVMKCLRYFLL